MTPERRAIDVSHLPTVTFGPSSLMWWGTIGFIIIEGFSLVLVAASYFYLRLGEQGWPPPPTPNPDVLIPTINTVLLLLIILPMAKMNETAHRFDRHGVVRWLTISTLLTLVSMVLRWFEITALEVRYDTHAYGTVTWGLVILHTTLLVTDFFETGVFAVLFVTGRALQKHYSDVSDAAFYQYFLSVSWVPLYVILYWGPRLF